MRKAICFLTIIMITLLTACKKEHTGESNSLLNVSQNEEVRRWYEKQPGVKDGKLITGGVPEWHKAFKLELRNEMVIPVAGNAQQTGDNHKADQYLLCKMDDRGNVVDGQLVFVLGKEARPALKKLLTGDQIEMSNYTGTVMYTDFQGKTISSKHYKEGVETKETDKLIRKENPSGGTNAQGLAPLDDGCYYVTIEWYWQTYMNGLLIDEVYLYSTYSIMCEPGGGSGGTNTCEQRLANFINQGSAISGPIYSVGGYEDDQTIQKPYNWSIFQAGTWGLLSYEKATLEKVHYPSSNTTRWEFKIFDHVKITSAGSSIGGERTFEDNGATINISSTRTRVDLRIDFSVSHKVCNIQPVVIPYNANKRFYAPNSVVFMPPAN